VNDGHCRILFSEGEYPGRKSDRFGFVNTAAMPGAAGESWERPSAKIPFAEGEPMKCPTCPDSKLTLAERQGIEIDYCPDCRGVWLDRGELDKIIERASSAMESAQPQRSQPMPQQAPPQPMPMGSHKYHSKYHTGYYGKKRKGFLGEIFDF
jgi:Zn-finger nucleic acid-binding protein